MYFYVDVSHSSKSLLSILQNCIHAIVIYLFIYLFIGWLIDWLSDVLGYWTEIPSDLMIICHLCSAKPLTKLQLTQFIVTHASY